MPMYRNALLLAAGLAALGLALPSGASAQKYRSHNGGSHYQQPPKHDGGGHRGGGHHYGGGFGSGIGIGIAIGSAIIRAIPRDEPPPDDAGFIDDGPDDDYIDDPVGRARPRHVRRQPPRRVRVPMPPPRVAQRPSGAPPAGETRLVPDEVVIELSNAVTQQQITALQQRFQLERIESHRFALSDSTLFRWRIPDSRSIPSVIRALEQDQLVASAQPNYLYTLQEAETPQQNETNETQAADGSAQYALAKLNLLQAHRLAKGDNVRVAVIDSAIDLESRELAGSIVGSFDALKSPRKAHAHGTSIAGLIAAHGQLTGTAPGARILAVRAFDPEGDGARGSTFNVLKGLDWAVQNKARIINMSFAGPADPALQRALQAAHKRGITLIAAAGNAGAKSPPLYPAAYGHVIAVSATDAEDKLLEQSNRGKQIALAAPGKDVLVALPDGGIDVSSGTSYSAAEVSGVAALLIERDGKLTPDKLRGLLEKTARDLGPKGRDPQFGYGLVNAFDALTTATAPVTVDVPLPIARVSTGAR